MKCSLKFVSWWTGRSLEKVLTDAEGMVFEGHYLREIADNLTVKIPLIVNGIKATKVLSDEGILVNVTLCFSLG